MDYCGLGSIRDMIETLNKTLDEEQVKIIKKREKRKDKRELKREEKEKGEQEKW